MGKLVRDNIPFIIRADGKEPTTSTLSDDCYRVALNNKLMEEARELIDAIQRGTLNDQKCEMADVLEVLMAIAVNQGIVWQNVEIQRLLKRETNGGFDDRVWLEDYR